MGVSAAYVRLGERHEDGVFPIHPTTNPASLPSIPFRIQKTTRRLSLTSQTVTNVHGTKWMEELKQMCESAEAKLAKNGKELHRVPQDGSNGEEAKQLHEGDLYLCAESLDALEGSLGGVCDAVDAVFRPQGPRRAFVGIRPPGHHCSDSYPSGFCWVNNVHVGIMHGFLSHGLTHAAIVDFDLHHGDGSQSIAWKHNARTVGLPKNAALWKKTSIGYFSMHDINSYPCEMGDEDKIKNASICIDNSHGQNIWNVHLQPWKTEAEFWALYESKYSILLEKMRSYLCAQTERLRSSGMNSRAAIFLSAGFDASEWEGAGMQRHSVNVPTDFYARLTRDIVRIAAEEGTSVEGRIVSVLEGGYSDRALCSGIMSHVCGLAGDGPATKEPELNSLGQEMGQRIAPARARKDSSASERGARRYETSWWSSAELEQLEHVPETPPEPRKPRSITPPTYSSPTHASVARSVNPSRVRRTGSGLTAATHGSPISTVRAPTPPPPDVPWTVATHALSKLLIPTARQTESCTHEDLNAEATRIRRDKLLALTQSLSGGAPPTQEERPPTRMALRERRAKPGFEDDAEKARNNRRKTVAGTSILVTEQELSRGGTPVPGKQPPRQSGRRLSAASTIVSETLNFVEPAPLSAPLQQPTRADTSLSVRPESSMSVRVANGNGNPLPVKKTRGPQKKEPVPRAPRAPKAQKRQPSAGNTVTAKPAKVFPSSAESHINKTSSPSADQKMDDMDSLANDMKKVKITLVTPAQRQARERQRVAREQAKNSAPIYVATPTLEENDPLQLPKHEHVDPTFPSSEDATPQVADSPESPQKHASPPEQQQAPHDALPSGPTTPTPLPQTLLSKYPEFTPKRAPLPATSPRVIATPKTRSRASPARNGSPVRRPTPPDMFVAYQPEGPTPATVPMQKQQPLQWVPANVSSTPSVASPMRRADLPMFTATSSIPFAPLGRPANGNGNGSSVVGGGHGLDEKKPHSNGFPSVSFKIEGEAEMNGGSNDVGRSVSEASERTQN